jgi:hypothetical protein
MLIRHISIMLFWVGIGMVHVELWQACIIMQSSYGLDAFLVHVLSRMFLKQMECMLFRELPSELILWFVMGAIKLQIYMPFDKCAFPGIIMHAVQFSTQPNSWLSYGVIWYMWGPKRWKKNGSLPWIWMNWNSFARKDVIHIWLL